MTKIKKHAIIQYLDTLKGGVIYMSIDTKCVEIINAIPSKEFRLRFIKGVCKTKPFGSLASFKAKNLSQEEKTELRAILCDNGFPFELTGSDQELDKIAATIFDRIATLK